jgi:hypothetical protein
VRENCRAEELPNGRDGVRFLADNNFVPILDTPEAADAWVTLNHYGQGRGTGPRCGRRVPSIHMPRWASRLTLTVTDVRVERLQNITEDDARAEGVERDEDVPGGWVDYRAPGTQCCLIASDSFASLWESIHGPEAWNANPWVCAISFEVRRRNIDHIAPLRPPPGYVEIDGPPWGEPPGRS